MYNNVNRGHGQEVPSEDAFHIQSYMFNFITGLEGSDASSYKRVLADCKHIVAYDVDFWDGIDRHHFNAIVSLQDLVEYYLPPFESCIRNAKVASVMCSYNSVNGVPSCANNWLLQTVVRDLWGFDRYGGWVVSDCDAVDDIYNAHRYTSTPEQAAADALLAGTDINCGTFYTDHLGTALNKSLINEADLDRALVRQYMSLIQVGYFDPPSLQPYRQLGWLDVNTAAAQQLAYHAAAESIVLLKNDGTLPLNRSKHIALIGPLVMATGQMQGNYYGQAFELISPYMAMKSTQVVFNYSQGCDVNSGDTSRFKAALILASYSDIIVYIGGLDNSVEAEGLDRVNIEWPGVQLDLIKALEGVGKPIIVIQMGGGQVDDSYIKSSSTINSLLWVGYPGQSGGTAIVDVLYAVYAPAGRLPVTQYPGGLHITSSNDGYVFTSE